MLSAAFNCTGRADSPDNTEYSRVAVAAVAAAVVRRGNGPTADAVVKRCAGASAASSARGITLRLRVQRDPILRSMVLCAEK